MRRNARWIVLTITLGSLAACGPYTGFAESSIMQGSAPLAGRLDASTYRAVDLMLDEAPELLTARGQVVVATIADIQDVNSSTPFGNEISEMVRSRLVQRGVPVTDMRLRTSVKLDRTNGELLLSRDRRALLPPPVATNIVSGTYAVGSSRVYVSLRVIGAADGHLVSAADFVTDRTLDVDQLLHASVASR